MNEIKKIVESKNFDAILIFVLLMAIFVPIANYLSTDIPDHIQWIIRVNEGNASYSPHFLFFFLVNLFSFFSSNVSLMLFVASVLLSLATVGKYLISKEVVSSSVLDIAHPYKKNIIKTLSFMLLFCFAIPDFYNFFFLKKMYLGRTPSVVWHNSTIIAVFPFALLLFWRQLKLFDREYSSIFHKDLLIVTVLIVLNVLIKPSFIFVFIPVSVVLILKDFSIQDYKKYVIKLFPIFIGAIFILIQYISIYNYQIGSFQAKESSLAIAAPFDFLRHFAPGWYVPIAFFFSFTFPIATVFYYRDILKFKPFKYAFYLTFVGIVISAFIVETGPRRFHGNLVWQNIICAYLLMLTTVTYLIPTLWSKDRFSKKNIILWSLFTLHFLSGILYLIKIYFTKSYH
ncbi:hypothetical protein [uncultured Aquimarina sp.]|uniref:hypothetical protein n=1 Tax=uncultured Aquimarina sp. TaxID=575652 RepID=UPI002608228D|nr:hypothetical protein [uncultured Aquimarina sp.]